MFAIYERLDVLCIDERYDDDDPANGIDSGDPWRPMNVFVHAPGSIGQIVRSKWYNYRDCTTTPCDSGYYYYFYDALGNVAGVYDEKTDEFIDYEMDAFGNDLPGGNSFLAMDQPGPKEHLTGKMYDTDTDLYYFSARWYDPGVGRFVSRDPLLNNIDYRLAFLDNLQVLRTQDLHPYTFCTNNPISFVDIEGGCSAPPPSVVIPPGFKKHPKDPDICYLRLTKAPSGKVGPQFIWIPELRMSCGTIQENCTAWAFNAYSMYDAKSVTLAVQCVKCQEQRDAAGCPRLANN